MCSLDLIFIATNVKLVIMYAFTLPEALVLEILI